MLTFDTIADRLSELGVNYARLDRGSDREAIDVPGYGEICRDDRPGVDPGFFVRTFEPGASDSPVSDDDLMAELEELGEMAEAIR